MNFPINKNIKSLGVGKIITQAIAIVIFMTPGLIGAGAGFLWKGFWGCILGAIIGHIIGLGILFIVSLLTRPKFNPIKSITIWDFLVSMAITCLLFAVILPGTLHHQMSSGRKTYLGINVLREHVYNYIYEIGILPDESDWKERLNDLFAEQIEAEKEYAYFVGGWGNDGWGNPIQYRIIEEDGIQTVLLYSYGRNKVDDNGTGDDIIREIEMPTQETIENYKANTKNRQ